MAIAPMVVMFPIGMFDHGEAAMTHEFSRTGLFDPLSDCAALGAAIRRARKSQGLTQTELAGLAGTGLRFLSELENGKRTVALGKTLDVLAALGMRLGVLRGEP